MVTVSAATSTPVGGGASKVVIDFLNTGFLPTNGTDMAIKTKSIRAKATVSVSLPDGMDFVVRTNFALFPLFSGAVMHIAPFSE